MPILFASSLIRVGPWSLQSQAVLIVMTSHAAASMRFFGLQGGFQGRREQQQVVARRAGCGVESASASSRPVLGTAVGRQSKVSRPDAEAPQPAQGMIFSLGRVKTIPALRLAACTTHSSTCTKALVGMHPFDDCIRVAD